MRSESLRLVRKHERRGATFLVTGVGVSITMGMVLALGFGVESIFTFLPALVGQLGAGWHFSQQARYQGRSTKSIWGMGLLAGINVVGALVVYRWLKD